MKKILVTGSNGMLGVALCNVLRNKFTPLEKIYHVRNKILTGRLNEFSSSAVKESSLTGFIVFGLGRSGKTSAEYIKCDIREGEKLINEVSQIKPDIIIHTAAISDVEYCETYPRKARDTNVWGAKNIALAAKKNNAFLIYISTDYVFNGKLKRPYREKDQPHPINIYGKTKWEGENFIKNILDNYLIIRTSWLFGPGRDNFVTQILRRAKKEREMKIVSDKFGSPTYTLDLASAIRDLILLFSANRQPLTANRILHISNSGSCSRFEFTKKIIQYAGIKKVEVVPIKSAAFGWKAKRPPYSVLDNSQFQKLMGYKLRNWQEALCEYIDTIKENKKQNWVIG